MCTRWGVGGRHPGDHCPPALQLTGLPPHLQALADHRQRLEVPPPHGLEDQDPREDLRLLWGQGSQAGDF